MDNLNLLEEKITPLYTDNDKNLLDAFQEMEC